MICTLKGSSAGMPTFASCFSFPFPQCARSDNIWLEIPCLWNETMAKQLRAFFMSDDKKFCASPPTSLHISVNYIDFTRGFHWESLQWFPCDENNVKCCFIDTSHTTSPCEISSVWRSIHFPSFYYFHFFCCGCHFFHLNWTQTKFPCPNFSCEKYHS